MLLFYKNKKRRKREQGGRFDGFVIGNECTSAAAALTVLFAAY